MSARVSLEPRRLPALDGLRGLLAVVVLAKHASDEAGQRLYSLHVASQAAVLLFFVLSGYVLTRNWKPDVATFLLRRFVRLWPVYAATLAAGFVVTAQTPSVAAFFWWPIDVTHSGPPVNLPAWSLHIEAWAMLGMPFIAWAVGGPLRRIAIALGVLTVATLAQSLFSFGYFFLIGAFLSRFDFRNALLESAVPQWLGKVSYSLYLTHWLLLVAAHRYFGAYGLAAAVPLAFAIGWLVWRAIEVPSIRASHAVRFPRLRTPWPFDRRAGAAAPTPVALFDP